jgi:hypothetical protein
LVFAVVAAAPPVAVPIALEPPAPSVPVWSLLCEQHALSATNNKAHGLETNVRQPSIFTVMLTPSWIFDPSDALLRESFRISYGAATLRSECGAYSGYEIRQLPRQSRARSMRAPTSVRAFGELSVAFCRLELGGLSKRWGPYFGLRVASVLRSPYFKLE